MRELFSEVQKGIEYSCYPYVDIHNQAGGMEAAYLLYQRDIRDMGGLEGMNISESCAGTCNSKFSEGCNNR